MDFYFPLFNFPYKSLFHFRGNSKESTLKKQFFVEPQKFPIRVPNNFRFNGIEKVSRFFFTQSLKFTTARLIYNFFSVELPEERAIKESQSYRLIQSYLKLNAINFAKFLNILYFLHSR